MVNKELNENLKTILDLEQSVLVRNGLMDEIKKEKASYVELSPVILSSRESALKMPEEPKQEKPAYNYSLYITLVLIIGVVPTLLVMFMLFSTLGFTGVLIALVLLIAEAGIIYLLKKKQKQYEEQYKQKMRDYYVAMEFYLRKKNEIHDKYQDEIDSENMAVDAQNKFVNQEIKQLIDANTKSRNLLNKYYQMTNIHPDYRGDLTALTSFANYIDKGICYDLEGKDEAYARYENEKLVKQLVSYAEAQTYMLQRIENQVSRIRQNQNSLYNILKENQDTSLRILRANQDTLNEIKGFRNQSAQQAAAINRRIDGLAGTSAVTAYNSQRARKELEYQRRMDDLEKGRFWNP